MWECKICNTQLSDKEDICWSCGTKKSLETQTGDAVWQPSKEPDKDNPTQEKLEQNSLISAFTTPEPKQDTTKKPTTPPEKKLGRQVFGVLLILLLIIIDLNVFDLLFSPRIRADEERLFLLIMLIIGNLLFIWLIKRLFRSRSKATNGQAALGHKDKIEGVVRGLNTRTEPDDMTQRLWTVFTFRLENYDKQGNRLQPIPVEVRGFKFKGFISEGQTVRINKNTVNGAVLQVSKLYNVSTNSIFLAKGKGKTGFLFKIASFFGWIIFFFLMGLFIVGIIWIIAMIIRH